MPSKKRTLKEIQEEIAKKREASVRELLPHFATYSSINYGEGKRHYSDSFILSDSSLSSFSNNSSKMQLVFSQAYFKKNRLSLQLLTHMSAELDKNVQMHMESLKHAKNTNEAMKVLDKMISGAEGSESRAFLESLGKIELLNQSVFSSYLEKASKQNPLFDFFKEEYKKFEDVGEVYSDTQIGKEQSLDYILKELKTIYADKEDKVLFSKKIAEKEYPSELLSIYTGENARSLSLDIKKIERKIEVEKLEVDHAYATKASQEILRHAFNAKNAIRLNEVFYYEGGTQGERKVNKDKLDKALELGIGMVGYSHVPQAVRHSILTNISKKLTSPNSDIAESIRSLDKIYSLSQEKNVPTDGRLEESFQKILEDEIYNAFMTHKSGLDTYNKLSTGAEKKRVINVSKNVKEGKYTPIGENKKIESDAVSIFNLTMALDKIDNGTLSKEDAAHILKHEIPSLDKKTKENLLGNIDTMHNAKKIERTLGKDSQEPFHTVKEIGDQIMQKHVNNYYNNRHGKTNLLNEGLRKLTGFSFMKDASMSLLGCMRNAETPMIKHHSTSSESSQCLDQALRKIKENMDAAKQMLGSPTVAVSGLAFFVVLFLARERMKESELSETILLAALERGKAAEFIQDGVDSIEEEYRGRAIISDTEGLESTIQKKEHATEHIFRTIKAKHDYHKIYNPYLYEGGESFLASISNASFLETNIIAKKGLYGVLSRSGLGEEFTQEIDATSERNLKYYENSMARITAYLSSEDAVDAEGSKAFKKATEEFLLDAEIKGYKDPYLIVKDAKEMSHYVQNSMKKIQGALISAKEVLQDLEQKDVSNLSNDDITKLREIRATISHLSKKIEEQRDFQAIFLEAQERMGLSLTKAEAFIIEKDPSQKNDDSLKQRVSDSLSQKFAYSFFDPSASKDEGDKSIEAFEVRYHGRFAKRSLLQDIEVANTIMENKMEKYREDIVAGHQGSIKKLEAELEALTAAKVIMREAYVQSEVNSNLTLSRNQAFKSIFEENREDIIHTADVRVGSIELPDGRLQMISGDRTKVGRVDADMVANIMREGHTDNENMGQTLSAIEKITGIELGSRAKENYANPVHHDMGQYSSNHQKARAEKTFAPQQMKGL